MSSPSTSIPLPPAEPGLTWLDGGGVTSPGGFRAGLGLDRGGGLGARLDGLFPGRAFRRHRGAGCAGDGCAGEDPGDV